MENTNQNVEELFKPALSHIYMDKSRAYTQNGKCLCKL